MKTPDERLDTGAEYSLAAIELHDTREAAVAVVVRSHRWCAKGGIMASN
jgi:hypothetical protein